MGDRETGRLGSRDASRGAKPAGGDAHRTGLPAPADGEEAHRAKVASAHRRKRPLCEALVGAEETALVAPPGRTALRRRAKIDAEQLETLIVRAWTRTLKGPYDWGEWPLARYTLAPGFLEAVEAQPGVSARSLAWTCAMIACGRAPRLRSLDPRPLLDDDGEPLVRGEGVAGWCCNLKRNLPRGPQLHYWIAPGGHIEFATVGVSERATAANSASAPRPPGRGATRDAHDDAIGAQD